MTLLGAPGCGKGTQTRKIASYFNLPVVGIGDIIRAEIASFSSLGNKVKELVSNGGLVPDHLVIELFESAVDNKILSEGVVLDGYPRTITQSESFSSVFSNKKLNVKVIYLETSFDVIKERLLGRLLCEACGCVFHSFFKRPTKEGKCDECNSILSTRSDDNENSVIYRYDLFLKETEPVIDYFSDRVLKIDANQAPDDVFNSLLNVLLPSKA